MIYKDSPSATLRQFSPFYTVSVLLFVTILVEVINAGSALSQPPN